MSTNGDLTRLDCARARRNVHRVLDGDALRPAERGRLSAHLGGCVACREFERDVTELHAALRSLPQDSLPDASLERVWDATVRSAERRTGAVERWIDWRVLAAAAVLTLGFIGLWRSPLVGLGDARSTRVQVELSDTEELARLGAEARLVLRMTADALRRVERAAVDDVLTDEVSPALSKAQIRWPRPSAAGDAKRGGGDA